MAVRNDERYIKKAVASILQQTCQDFEFLIINDASSDTSTKIIKGFADPRIIILTNQESIGLTRSLNLGLRQVQGQYIARMDADDIAYPARLKKQLDFLSKNPEYGLVGSWYREIDENDHPISDVKTPEIDAGIRAALRKGNAFAHSSVMYSRRCIEKVNGYREFFNFSQDYDLFLRIASEFKAYNIPELLLDWRIRLNSVSVRYRVLQDIYAELAKECAFSHADLPSDQSQWLKPYIGTSIRRSRTSAIGYYKWASDFYYKRKSYKKRIHYCIRLLFRSFVANPATFFLLCSRTIKSASLRVFRWRKN